MTNVKTWRERVPPSSTAMRVPEHRVYEAMQAEIDDLRAALVESSEDVVNIARERNALEASANKWFDVSEKLRKEKCDLTNECTLLKEKITEMNLQYISDFGQLQEQKGVKMNYEEREQGFLTELTNLSHKYKIYIGGCGCCGSPFLEDFEDREKLNARIDDSSKTFGFRFEDVPSDLIEYIYTDQLSFEKMKE